MIDSLQGTLTSKSPAAVTIEVGGVGYLVQVPLSTFSAIAEPGARVRLLTHLYHREDQLKLFGFATEAERELFLALVGVNRIGPGIALQVLGSCAVDDFRCYVLAGDVTALARLVKGIGKKTAQRLVLELRGELAEAEQEARLAADSPGASDVVKVLIALGESPASARRAVTKALETLGLDADQETLTRLALSS